MFKRKYFWVFLFLPCLLVGCATVQPSDKDMSMQEILNTIEPGDTIRVVMKSGEEYIVSFSSITEEKIIGEEKEFNLEDVERVERKTEHSDLQPGTVLLGGTALVLWMWILFLPTSAIIGF